MMSNGTNSNGLSKAEAAYVRAPRGTQDILPEETPLWLNLEGKAREVFELYGYGEIRTPIFEVTGLFVRSIGEATDIVEKEMYTIRPSSGEDGTLTLRPEATAPVARAYIEHQMAKTKKFQKFFYIGPMFRNERPQAGRRRQFHQMGIEAFGSEDPFLDAETIILGAQLFDAFGLNGYEIYVNSIGCRSCRSDYREILREKLSKHLSSLCDDCKGRFERNVFRVLDCKKEGCKEFVRQMPPMREYLDEGCAAHFTKVQSLLEGNGVACEIDDYLVRGLDYYTRTVYEFKHSSLGARDAICGGGRYDDLFTQIGGDPTGGVGFALGVETTILALRNSKALENGQVSAVSPTAFVVSIGAETRDESFRLLNLLRKAGISAECDYESRSVKAQMRAANKLNAKYVIAIGPDEVQQGVISLKNMETGGEAKLPCGEVVENLKA